MAALVFLAPLLTLCAIVVKTTSRGPVLYRGVRAGKGGTPFTMLKFRTMVDRGEELGGASTASTDPRLTRVGRLLRNLKLDELPQLINVVRGEMVFVGPRPQVLEDVGTWDSNERRMLDVPPGLTGPASILFADEGRLLSSAKDPDAAYQALIRRPKHAVALFYLDHETPANNLRMMGFTVLAVVSRRHARNAVARFLARHGAPKNIEQFARARAAGSAPPWETA